METEILSTPNKKTYGLYSCPVQLLKYVNDNISLPLPTLLNVSHGFPRSIPGLAKIIKNSASV